MSSEVSAIQAVGLTKSYAQGPANIAVLNDVSLKLAAGELVALVGPSGAGKSTLLHILAGLQDADAGEVFIAGENISTASANERARIRNRHMGFVYQLHHLLPEFDAIENVAMPLRLRGESAEAAQMSAMDLLAAVGLSERAKHRPSQLSGGERQRVAVARALVGKPAVVLADEPTGNLDRNSGAQVFDLMRDLCRQAQVSFLVATHDERLSAQVDRVVTLEQGRLS